MRLPSPPQNTPPQPQPQPTLPMPIEATIAAADATTERLTATSAAAPRVVVDAFINGLLWLM